jgi:hypothetical protein
MPSESDSRVPVPSTVQEWRGTFQVLSGAAEEFEELRLRRDAVSST